MESPVPAGLKQLNDPLLAIAEFYELPEALIQAAAEASAAAPKLACPDEEIRAWVLHQSKKDLQIVVERLLNGGDSQRYVILNEIRSGSDLLTWQMAKPSRTRGDLAMIAGEL
jgi:hypothetical protein